MTRVLPLVLALLVVAPGPALALPGDPPVTPIAPAAGATLPIATAGIPVSYACPVYRTQDFGDGTVRNGDERDYVVLMSDSPQLDAEGRLADPVARVTGSSTTADPNTCSALLGSSSSKPVPQRTPGTWYWQVSRLCAGCSPPFETGPVRSFRLVASEKPRLALPARRYAGYRFLARVDPRSGAPESTPVTIEYRVRSTWKAAGTGGIRGDRAVVTTVLPRGRVRVRARFTVGGQRRVSAERTVVVRSASARRTPVRAGRWTGAGGTRFRVTGRQIRDLRVPVTLLCPTATGPSPFAPFAATAIIPSTRIAPDGGFVGIASLGYSTARVSGRLVGDRLQGATAEMSQRACRGTARFSARRVG